jgi:hypothetical protein
MIDCTSAFLTEFTPFLDSHSLLPLDLSDIPPATIDSMLLAIFDGSLELSTDLDNGPLWSEAMASPEREY